MRADPAGGAAPVRTLDRLAGHPWHALQSLGPIGRVDLIDHGDALAWWVHPAGHGGAILVDTRARVQRDAAPQLARELASRHSGLPLDAIGTPQLITRFEGEYGFLNKRLPVWRVPTQAAGHPRHYVELGTGALAARVDDFAAFEGYVFSVLHKWHVGDMPKDLRDALSATFALGNVVVAVMGLAMFLRRRAPLKPA